MLGKIIYDMHEEKISGGYLVLIRFTLGMSFFTTWLSNLAKGAFSRSGFIDTVSYFIDHPDHVITPFDSVIRNIAFPNASLFGLTWFFLELFISLSLMFGIFTRLGSLIGAGSTIILALGALGVDWPWTYGLLFIGFITCALVSAGKWYGIDFWLKEKIPQKVMFFVI